MQNDQDARYLRLPEVTQLTSLPKNTIYDLERAGEFPRRRKLTNGKGGRTPCGWVRSEILAWIENRPTAELAKPAKRKKKAAPASRS